MATRTLDGLTYDQLTARAQLHARRNLLARRHLDAAGDEMDAHDAAGNHEAARDAAARVQLWFWFTDRHEFLARQAETATLTVTRC